MEFKGTKGKWEFNQKEYWCEVQIKEPLKSICAINMNVEEHIANAKLIESAPEMFEMLKDVLAGMRSENYAVSAHDIEQLLTKITE